MAYLPAGISLEELLSAAEQLQTALPTPMTSRPGQLATCCLASRSSCLSWHWDTLSS